MKGIFWNSSLQYVLDSNFRVVKIWANNESIDFKGKMDSHGFFIWEKICFENVPCWWVWYLRQPFFWPHSGQRNILEMPEIEFFGLSFCKILEFLENFIEFLGNSSKFKTNSAKFWTLQAYMCNLLVKLCRNFFCWAWVWVFFLEFLNSWVFSPWVFFGRRPKKRLTT